MGTSPHHQNSGRRQSTIAALIAVIMGLAGCSTPPQAAAPPASAADRPIVLTTFTVLQDIAHNVAGEHLQVESITKVGAEIHGYEPTPGDIQKAAGADLIVDNGLGLEAWFEKFVAGVDAPHMVASQGIKPISITGDVYDGKPNPHAWMSPANVQIYVDNLVRAFSELDPDHAAEFMQNGNTYKAQLQEVQEELMANLATLPESQRALVTCEGAFSYLTRDAGLKEQYMWPVNAEQQATPQSIAETIDFVRENRVPAVFCESTVSPASMEQVASSSGANFGGLLYVDSLSEPGGPVPTYLDLLRHDVKVITEGLTGGKP